jgi:hypothetical protein
MESEEPPEISEAELYLASEGIMPEEYFELAENLFSTPGSAQSLFGLPTDLSKKTQLPLKTSRKIITLWSYARKNDDYFKRRL